MDETHPAHVGRQLIHYIEPPGFQRQRRLAGLRLAQIEQLEIIGSSRAELRPLQVHAPDPESLSLEPRDEMARDEATCSAH